jgi:hypothetical protein
VLQAQVAVQRQRVKVRSAENRFKKNWEGLVAMVSSPNLSVSGVAGDLEHDIQLFHTGTHRALPTVSRHRTILPRPIKGIDDRREVDHTSSTGSSTRRQRYSDVSNRSTSPVCLGAHVPRGCDVVWPVPPRAARVFS